MRYRIPRRKAPESVAEAVVAPLPPTPQPAELGWKDRREQGIRSTMEHIKTFADT